MSAAPNPIPSLSTSTQNTSSITANKSNDNFNVDMLPTPSSSSPVPEVVPQLRSQLEQQIVEKERLLQDSRGGIGKSVLVRQITQLKDSLLELDRREQQHKQALPAIMSRLAPVSSEQQHLMGESELSPTTLEKLHKLERDIRGYQLPSNSNPNGNGYLRKDKLATRPSGLDSLPSPSHSTMLPSDSTSLLPLPPPPTGSTPTKRRSKVPNADRRNTDIEFATEIGQGLLNEVRKMQALLQEKEDQLKLLQAQKADLERAAESMAKQLRQREENEEKLKEETWNLELAKQELTISVTELQQNLNKANAEQKRMSEQMKKLDADIENMRDQEQKLSTILREAKQQHEHDVANLRRHTAMLQREKGDSAKQVEALSSELAIAKAQSRLLGAGAAANKRNSLHADLNKRRDDTTTENGSETDPLSGEEQQNGSNGSNGGFRHANRETGEQSSQTPPPSPKQRSETIARNRELEVESLKTSLAHAHRLVSNLRSNLHREKQEKHEINKFLIEARERVELLENDPRLWVDDYPSPPLRGHDSGGHRRARTKAIQKRRVPVSKARVTILPTEGVEKRRAGSGEEEKGYDDGDDDDVDDDGESDDASDALAGVSNTAATATTFDGASSAGFTSLESELSAKNDRDNLLSSGPRTLGDELSAVDQLQQSKMHPTTTRTGPTAQTSVIETGVQTDDVTIPTTTATAISSTTPMTHELGVQTEQSMQLHELISEPAYENAPVEVHDQETQSGEYIGIDTNTQTATAVGVDAGTQYNNPIIENCAAALHKTSSKPRMYTQAEVEEIIASTVAKAEARKEHQADEANMIPPRPTSSPPARLLSLVNHQIDKGKAPVVRVPSNTSSCSRSEHRESTGSSGYESTSLGNDEHIGTVTQTMIGDWLWKYTRKPFNDSLSGNRHRRYFWVHPYTRTIYWSNHRPGSHNSKIKTKSALIEGVSTVKDPNPVPAHDVHDVSILIKAPKGQMIKITAPSLARHQVWLESLQYLLARGESGADERNLTAAAGHQNQQKPPSLSINNEPEKRSSKHRFLRAFEHSGSSKSSGSGGESDVHHYNEDIGDDRLDDVRSCCDGKHHVSKLEREHINQRPFYRKRSGRRPQASGGGAVSTTLSAPPASSVQPQRVN